MSPVMKCHMEVSPELSFRSLSDQVKKVGNNVLNHAFHPKVCSLCSSLVFAFLAFIHRLFN